MQHSTQPGSQALVSWDLPADEAYEGLMAEVVEPVKEFNPRLTWMTGNLPTSERQIPVGWHVHKGVNPSLDALLARLGYKHHLIEHENEKGEVELVDYWALNYRWESTQGPRGDYVLVPVSLFVVARGVRDKREMKHPQDRDGVAYGWEINRAKDKSIVYKPNGEPKKTAKLKMRVYIHELLPSPEQAWDDAHGFTTWFQAAFSGYLVDDVFTMLYREYEGMRAYDQRVSASGKTGPKTPYYAISNPTVPWETSRRVSSKEKDGKSKSIIPMRSLMPNEAEITDDFLRAHRIPPALLQELLHQDILLEAWQWSKEESEYLEGVKPRPTGGQALPDDEPVTVPGTMVREEHPVQALVPSSPPPDADPCIELAQQQILLMLLAQDQARVQALCQECQVPDLAHVRASQFRGLLLRLSQS